MIPMRPSKNRKLGNDGHGVLVVTVTVNGSVAFTVSTLSNTNENNVAERPSYFPR